MACRDSSGPLRLPAGTQASVDVWGNGITPEPGFLHVPFPAQFFGTNIHSVDIATPNGLKLYRMRQLYTSERWGFLDVSAGRSDYSPRFVQIAVKLYL
jgi:hypothetical protein